MTERQRGDQGTRVLLEKPGNQQIHGDLEREPSRLLRRLVAEFLATAFLLATVVGSGIMGERLSGGNVAIALLANSLATGAALVALIFTFGPISGAHLNPVVTLASVFRSKERCSVAGAYIAAQILGALAGVAAAHLMFGVPLFDASQHVREGWAQAWSEFVATFGLLSVVFVCSERTPGAVPFAVGGYITAAYWFTASTSFANPAVTLARTLTNTFAGIRPSDAPAFIGAQLAALLVALFLYRWLLPSGETSHELKNR